MTCDPNQSGEWPDREREDAGARVCRTCKGTKYDPETYIPGLLSNTRKPCPACGGTGEEESDEARD